MAHEASSTTNCLVSSGHLAGHFTCPSRKPTICTTNWYVPRCRNWANRYNLHNQCSDPSKLDLASYVRHGDSLMSNWTPERRARQAQAIRRWQPWAKSTGARTPEGKATVSRKAFKGGGQDCTVMDIITKFLEQEVKLGRYK